MKSLFVLILLAFSFVGHSQIINFPDAIFKNALVNTQCVDTDGDGVRDSDADLNDDGEIDVREAETFKYLGLYVNNINNLEGINYFKNIEILLCAFNQLENINVDSLKNLKYLNCGNNSIKNLIISNFKNLEELHCYRNQMDSLKLENLNELKVIRCENNKLQKLKLKNVPKVDLLDCQNNLLETLDVTQLDSLRILYCPKNKINSLKIGPKNKLTEIYCQYNELTELDISNIKNLERIECYLNKIQNINFDNSNKIKNFVCYFNLIDSINVSQLKDLTNFNCANNKIKVLEFNEPQGINILDCSNNFIYNLNLEKLNSLENLRCINSGLVFLNIKTGHHIDFISIKNSFLYHICCDENQIDRIKNLLTSFEMYNREVNSYCSFTPGGKFYTIQGQNTFDENNNGCDDLDIKVSKIKYNITNGTASGTFISNSTGNYSIPLQAGTHTITPIIEYPDHFEVTPTTFTVTFPSTSDTITQNFCITPKGIFRQTNITVIPLTPPARPGFDASYKIVWENAGNQIESGTLNFTYDERLLDYISATQSPDQEADGLVKWNFSNLLPFEKREITVTLKVNRPTDTPAVNAGNKLYLTASILDNIFTLENTVVGSYDPNDKTCLQGDRVKPDMVGKYVDYLIRFENTGNYAAENVVVKDIIDTKTFDVSSLQITDASHEVYTRIEGNKVEFIFENIQLPFDDANNDGYVAFKIKTLPTLVLGDSLKNLADIYFDYNFPIRTNEAQTTIALPSFTKDIATEVNVYPNPVRDILYLESDENWSKAEIFDISGRILRSVSLFNQSIDVNGLESGTYFMRLKDGEKVGNVKFVKM